MELALLVEDRGREEAEVRDRAGDLELPRHRERLAGVERLLAGEVLRAGFDRFGKAKQPSRSLRGGKARPDREGPLRRLDRAVDVLLVAFGHFGDRRTGRGVEAWGVAVRRGRHETAVDQVGDSKHRGKVVPVRGRGGHEEAPAAFAGASNDPRENRTPVFRMRT